MLSRSTQFDTLANGQMRPLAWAFTASFDKSFDADVEFFTLDTSILDGTDVLAPTDNNVIQEWDKYDYRDYSGRVISMEWQREEDFPYSVNMALADVTVNNTDDYFTPKTASNLIGYSMNTDLNPSNQVSHISGGIITNGSLSSMVNSLASGYTNKVLICNPPNATTSAALAVTNNSFFSFTITPGSGHSFTLSSLSIDVARGGASTPRGIAIRSSVDNYTTNLLSTDIPTQRPNLTTYTVNFSSAYEIINSPITFRVYIYAPSSSVSVDIDNIQLYGIMDNSPISDFILPKRPIRLLSGFGGEKLPSFVGLTEKMPVIEERNKVAKFHAMDFLSYLFNRPLDQTVIYLNMRTDEIIDELFQLAGLTPSQYDLEVGFNNIPFTWFPIGTKYGDAFRQLMQAEMGSFYMDEMGTLRFVNKNERSNTPVYYFDRGNTLDIQISSDDDIINVVEIKADVREVQTIQPIFNLSSGTDSEDQVIAPGVSTVIFYSFDDPVTTVADIDFYTANTEPDGSGTDLTSSVAVSATDIFDTAIKVTWTNSSSQNAYLTALTIYGTPAPVVRTIKYRQQDDASVDKYDEKVLTIENDFIQSNETAESLASIILDYYSEYGGVVEIDTKGNPALQIGDCISVHVDNTDNNYIITKITNKLISGKYSQTLIGKVQRARTFFILDQSVLDGDDVLSP